MSKQNTREVTQDYIDKLLESADNVQIALTSDDMDSLTDYRELREMVQYLLGYIEALRKSDEQ